MLGDTPLTATAPAEVSVVQLYPTTHPAVLYAFCHEPVHMDTGAGGSAEQAEGEEFACEDRGVQLARIAALVFGPTMPNPVEAASPEDTTPRSDCHFRTAAPVSTPK